MGGGFQRSAPWAGCKWGGSGVVAMDLSRKLLTSLLRVRVFRLTSGEKCTAQRKVLCAQAAWLGTAVLVCSH